MFVCLEMFTCMQYAISISVFICLCILCIRVCVCVYKGLYLCVCLCVEVSPCMCVVVVVVVVVYGACISRIMHRAKQGSRNAAASISCCDGPIPGAQT